MPRRSLVSALSLLPCALLLTACGTSYKVVKPDIAPSLLLPCVDPILAPDNASDNEIGAERIRVARAFVDCRDKHAALVGRIK